MAIPPRIPMKFLFPIFTIITLAALAAHARTWTTADGKSTFEGDLIRNPANGWILYDDACGEVAEAKSYWMSQDKAAREHASIFYVRWRWSDMEPQEGQYAWKEDENFKALIAGATERGLRLAFRVYICGWDNLRQGTPDYVFKAGAKGQEHPGSNGRMFLTPNADDPVFRQKFETFLDAFAKEFDDPARVDFIDGCGLGRWGENHNLTLGDKNRERESMEWVAGAYAKRFQHTLLGWQLSDEWDFDRIIKPLDFVIRRDGLGSDWFNDRQRAICKKAFPRYPVFGERCYWGGGTDVPKDALGDERFGSKWKTWKDIDSSAVDDALQFHANTLDLRTVADTANFMSYPEVVRRFQREGGYILAPVEVVLPEHITAGKNFSFTHSWKNNGIGVLPNLNKRWANKYRVAWILLKGTKYEIVGEPTIVENAEPGEWVKGKSYDYETVMEIPAETPPGTYEIACAILNGSKDGMPDLNLALKAKRHGPWHIVGKIHLQ